jgi:predicted AAA+ superfamily ATPase
MKIYRKKYIDAILSKIENEKLFLLVWARQVGKTTIMEILKQKLEDAHKTLYFNLEDIFGIEFHTKTDFINYFLFEYGFDFYKDGIIFLDEIQYLKNPESLLKSLYDDKQIKTKIIATGSRFWWQKKVWSSLVGRWEIIKVYPFDFFEFLQAKWKNTEFLDDLNNYSENTYKILENYIHEYMQFGWYPKVVISSSKQEKQNELKKIIDRFLEKDFSYFMKTSDLIDFKKVFQFIALNLKNTIKVDNIATHFWISRYKVHQFLTFLLDSYLIYECYPYFHDKSKEYNQNYEIYFNDLWVLNYISWTFNIWNMNENFVYLEILKNNDVQIYFYKKNTGSEIDFIVENADKKLIPIEVKSANKDIIPKIFFSFYDDYEQKIEKFVVTTKDFYTIRNVNNKEVWFFPIFLIGTIITPHSSSIIP